MLTPFVFIIVASEGAWRARFEVKPGRCSRADDVQVERGEETGPSSHTRTVNGTVRPSEEEFRELAAWAATRTADDSPDALRQLRNLLILF